MLTPKQVVSLLEGFSLPETVNAEEIEPVKDHHCPILRTSPYSDKSDPFMVGVYETTAALAIFLKKKKEDHHLRGLTVGDVATAAQFIEEGRMPLPWNRISNGVVPDDPFSEGAVAALGAAMLAMVARNELEVDAVKQKAPADADKLRALEEQEKREGRRPAGQPAPVEAPPTPAPAIANVTASLFDLTKLGWTVTLAAGKVTLEMDIGDTLTAAENTLKSVAPGGLITRSELNGHITITVSM